MEIDMTRREFEDLHTEGSRAVEDLALLSSRMGYRPFCEQLTLNNGKSVSHILEMLEDNPGMVEAMYNWVLDKYDFQEEDEEENEDEENS